MKKQKKSDLVTGSIKCPPYDSTIYWWYGNDIDILTVGSKFYMSKTGRQDLYNMIKRGVAGYTNTLIYETGGKAEIVFFNKDWFTIDCLSHECFHAVHRTLENHGLCLSHDSSEAYAYMYGYVFKRLYSKLKDYL